jgi:hypothetical protein
VIGHRAATRSGTGCPDEVGQGHTIGNGAQKIEWSSDAERQWVPGQSAAEHVAVWGRPFRTTHVYFVRDTWAGSLKLDCAPTNSGQLPKVMGLKTTAIDHSAISPREIAP